MTAHDRSLGTALVIYTFAVVIPLLSFDVARPAEDPHRSREPGSWRAALASNALSLTYDDGFYYLRITQHLTSGRGSTFDGLNPTNGYHPLWLLTLATLACLVRDPEFLLLASLLLQMVLAALSTLMVYQTARIAHGRFASLIGAVVWVRLLCTYWMPWSGMEYALHAWIFTAIGYIYLRRFVNEKAQTAGGRSHYAAFGFLVSLAFLARLDNVLLAACLGLALAHREWRRGWDRDSRLRLARFSLPIVFAVLLYVGINEWIFGHPWPVSGAVKADWSARLLARDPYYLESGWWSAKLYQVLGVLNYMSRPYLVGLFVGTVGAVIICLYLAFRPPRSWFPARFVNGLAPFVSFSVLQLAAYLLLFHGDFSFQPWCYVAQPWLAAMCSSLAMGISWRWARDSTAGRFRRSAMATLSIGLVLSCLGSTAHALQYRLQSQRSFFLNDPIYKLACWVRDHLGRGEIVGAWNAGMISFLSQNTVVNLDGLVNSWTYHLNERHDLCGYWEDVGITYLADALDRDNPVATIRGNVDRCSERLQLVWSEAGYHRTSGGAMVLELRPPDER